MKRLSAASQHIQQREVEQELFTNPASSDKRLRFAFCESASHMPLSSATFNIDVGRIVFKLQYWQSLYRS
jgi:hypothetical protein